MTTNKSPEKLGRDPDAPTNVGPKIIRTREELAALDPDTVVTDGILTVAATLAVPYVRIGMLGIPAVVVSTGDQARAARQALEATDDRWNLPLHRTEAGHPNCSTCDGGGCPDCTDPA